MSRGQPAAAKPTGAQSTEAAPPAKPAEVFYEKSSFFDNISCEATTGRSEGREFNERRRNIETFGVAEPPGAATHLQRRPGGGYYTQQRRTATLQQPPRADRR